MCNNCKAAAANIIFTLAGALEKAYAANSSNLKALDKLLATHVEAEQILLDAELQQMKDLKAELESLRGQTVSQADYKSQSGGAGTAEPEIPAALKALMASLGISEKDLKVVRFPIG